MIREEGTDRRKERRMEREREREKEKPQLSDSGYSMKFTQEWFRLTVWSWPIQWHQLQYEVCQYSDSGLQYEVWPNTVTLATVQYEVCSYVSTRRQSFMQWVFPLPVPSEPEIKEFEPVVVLPHSWSSSSLHPRREKSHSKSNLCIISTYARSQYI